MIEPEDMIPFDFQTHFGHIRSEKLTYERKKWLRQRQTQQYETYEEQVHPRPLSVELNQETYYYDSKYIRYRTNQSEVLYISEGGLSSKGSRFINEDEELRMRASDPAAKQVYQQDQDLVFRYRQLYRNYRYFGEAETICNYCKLKGHHIRECPKLNKSKIYHAAYTCFHCQKRGHIAKACPQKRKIWDEQNSETQTSPSDRLTLLIQIRYSDSDQFDY